VSAGLGYWNDVIALNDNIAYAVGASEHIFGTEDGGKHWNDQLFVADSGKSLNSIEYANEGTVFVCGDGGRIYRKTAIATSIDKPKVQLVNNIYPVPARSELNIVFKDSDNKTIIIYNQLGIMVMKQTQVEVAGLKLDISALCNGHYIISIQANGYAENLSFIKH
jgi:hypothetical protein